MKKATKIIIISLILILIFIIFFLFITLAMTININAKICDEYEKELANIKSSTENTKNEEENHVHEFKNIKSKKISDFDLKFLKLENQKENKVYSPLSIKYGLKMLEEGSTSIPRWKIAQAIGNRELSKYVSNNNMSFANAFFIKNSYKENISEEYIDNLTTNYNSEIIFDSFENPDNINSWVSNKTFKLINNLISDQNMNSDFMLINALAIDMEWKNKFLESVDYSVEYSHENFGWWSSDSLNSLEFGEEKQEVSSMEVLASINNYDIVSELGEENIKNTVYNAFIEYCNENPDDYMFAEGDLSIEKREETFNKYFYGAMNEQYSYYNSGYISGLNSNYGDVSYNTDFSLYVDDKIKVFSKDLKEYDGTTLQYVGIMPISEELDIYIQNINEEKINNIIKNLKNLKVDNFKKGVVTKIKGFIPKFKFEYDLDLKDDLKKLGIGHIFEQETAGLELISKKEDVYIYDAIHKAVIEFTQDGIKAAAATSYGGGGGGDGFDYIYEVPIEEIDLTFNKPYMFLIRDKETGEVWFVGTVYEPLLWENENTQSY